MRLKQTVAALAYGMIGGHVGTMVMEPVSLKLYKLEPEQARAGGPGAARPALRDRGAYGGCWSRTRAAAG
jgi:hypothetical protein